MTRITDEEILRAEDVNESNAAINLKMRVSERTVHLVSQGKLCLSFEEESPRDGFA